MLSLPAPVYVNPLLYFRSSFPFSLEFFHRTLSLTHLVSPPQKCNFHEARDFCLHGSWLDTRPRRVPEHNWHSKYLLNNWICHYYAGLTTFLRGPWMAVGLTIWHPSVGLVLGAGIADSLYLGPFRKSKEPGFSRVPGHHWGSNSR